VRSTSFTKFIWADAEHIANKHNPKKLIFFIMVIVCVRKYNYID
jgi:hypothetical protein